MTALDSPYAFAEGGAVGRCAVCYVSDENFIFPSLASAFSLQEGAPGACVDIFLFTIDVDPRIVSELNDLVADRRIKILDMPRLWANRFDKEKYARFHVPDATLGRFFVSALLPDSYDRILYVDGDTLIEGDVSPLLALRPRPGQIAAVDDPLSFSYGNIGKFGAFARRYFAGLGLDPRQGYFNAGVFVVRSADWPDMAAEAFSYFLRHTDKCIHHDQSALNVVAGRERQRLSLRWNAQTVYKRWNVTAIVRPVIHHFSGYPKPWMGACWPLSRATGQYERMRSLVPERLAPSERLGAAALAAASRRQKYLALMTNALGAPRQAIRLAKIAAYEYRVGRSAPQTPPRIVAQQGH